MTSVTAAGPPREAESVRSEPIGPNSRTVGIHLAALQAVWLAAIAFGIYSLVSG